MRHLLATLTFLALLSSAATIADAEALAPGEPLSLAHIEALLEAELGPSGAEERREVKVTAPRLPLANNARGAASMWLTTFDHDPRSGRFSGRLMVRLETGEQSLIQLHGRINELVRTPVPQVTIDAGDRITGDSIGEAWLPKRRLRQDTLLDLSDLLGEEARRRLPAGRAVRATDIIAPRLVRRGDIVTVRFRDSGLQLAVRARALEDGGMREVVDVANIDSDRRLRVRVVGHKVTEIGSGGGVAP